MITPTVDPDNMTMPTAMIMTTVMIMPTAPERSCIECGEPIRFGRADRLTCSTACRSRRSRRRRGVSHGWGGATDRAARRSGAAAVVAVAGQ